MYIVSQDRKEVWNVDAFERILLSGQHIYLVRGGEFCDIGRYKGRRAETVFREMLEKFFSDKLVVELKSDIDMSEYRQPVFVQKLNDNAAIRIDTYWMPEK